jgi:hypothetical protein
MIFALLGPSAAHAQESYGRVEGRVWWIDMHGDMHPLVWATVEAISDTVTVTTSSDGNGYYFLYVKEGGYTLRASHVGFITQEAEILVSPQSVTVIEFYLEESGVPIPEFPPILLNLAIFMAIALGAALLRWRAATPSWEPRFA